MRPIRALIRLITYFYIVSPALLGFFIGKFMSLQSKRFEQLSTHELFLLMRARVDVFVVEQTCPYPELDDIDCHPQTLHLYDMADSMVASYARCYLKNETYSAIGRVLVAKSQRGNRVGLELVAQAIKCCFIHFPKQHIYIGAQTYLLDFYRSFGFEAVGETYLEDGIAHQDMILQNPSIK